MSTSTSQDLRCPRCDAHVSAGAQWCALCYCDLRPAPPAPEPAAGQEPAPAQAEPAVIASGRGRHARATAAAPPGTPEPPETSAPDVEVDLMLAQLAAETGLPLGRFSGVLDSPGRKAGLMIGGSIALALVVFLIMTLVGVLL